MFSVTGTINGETETINYKFENGKGSVSCSGNMSMFKLKTAMEYNAPIGPVGELLSRDINNPLAMLCILVSNEIFESDIKVHKISGTMPEASKTPEGAIA